MLKQYNWPCLIGAIILVGCSPDSEEADTPVMLQNTPVVAQPADATPPPAVSAEPALAPEPIPEPTPQPQSEAVKPPCDPAVTEFAIRTRAFMEEARSAAGLLDLTPELTTYQKKYETVQDLFTRITEPSEEQDALADAHKKARSILGLLRLGGINLQMRDRAWRLTGQDGTAGKDAKALAIEVSAGVEAIGKKIREAVRELDKMLLAIEE